MNRRMMKDSIVTRIQQWCGTFKASKLWLTAVASDRSGSAHTQTSYSQALKVFSDWIGKNPDQLIAERKRELKDEDTKMNAENKVREFCQFLEKSGKSKTTVVTKYHGPIKSFYLYNDVPLKLKTPRHATLEREPHKVEEIKALLQIADVRERFIIMFLKDSGISREDAITVKYGQIQDEYEANKDVIHIKTVRQKESVTYDTFIGKNAIESLRAYLEYRKRTRGEQITKDTFLIAQLNGQPTTPENLSQMFTRLGKKVGFYTSPHRFRKFFESHLGLTAPSILVKYWMGHSLGVERSYFIPPLEKQREKYAEAYKEIDLSEKPQVSREDFREGVILELPDEILEPIAKKRGITIQQLRLQMAMTSQRKKREELEPIKSHSDTTEECENGEHCQKMVAESELQEYLTKGFKFVAVLPSGKILVSNE